MQSAHFTECRRTVSLSEPLWRLYRSVVGLDACLVVQCGPEGKEMVYGSEAGTHSSADWALIAQIA